MIRLANYLEKKGYPVVQTRQPGGTRIGKEIRALLLDEKGGGIAPKTEFLLYLSDRAQHIHEVILPALKDGKVVLCDRFTDSTLIYQGYARALFFPEMNTLLAFAAESLVPDLTFLLDMSVKKSLLRVQGRASLNRLDRETNAFHQRVRKGYLALANQGPKRIRLVRADQTEDRVFAEIQKGIDGLLP